MGDRLWRVRLWGAEYVLTGSLEAGGAIADAADYQHGRVSFAHLHRDGTISRWGDTIGTREDLELLGPVELTPAPDALENMAAGWHPPKPITKES